MPWYDVCSLRTLERPTQLINLPSLKGSMHGNWSFPKFKLSSLICLFCLICSIVCIISLISQISIFCLILSKLKI